MRTILLSGIVVAISMLSTSPTQAAEPAPGKQVEQQLNTREQGSIPYLLYLPTNYDARTQKWPLMLFLHGRGESYGPLSIVKRWGPPRFIDHGDNYPFIIISPQCPGDASWPQPKEQALLLALLDHIEKDYRVDTNRVYLTGLSMGGFGSWRLAADHPERFAAVVPISGGGNVEDADRLKDLPIWVWHGTADPTVPFRRSEEMVEAIKKAGGTQIRFTTLEHIGHNCWEAAYASPALYQWMLKQTLSSRKHN
jgi:predicted peptidase